MSNKHRADGLLRGALTAKLRVAAVGQPPDPSRNWLADITGLAFHQASSQDKKGWISRPFLNWGVASQGKSS
jgi:hypothetical protein